MAGKDAYFIEGVTSPGRVASSEIIRVLGVETNRANPQIGKRVKGIIRARFPEWKYKQSVRVTRHGGPVQGYEHVSVSGQRSSG